LGVIKNYYLPSIIDLNFLGSRVVLFLARVVSHASTRGIVSIGRASYNYLHRPENQFGNVDISFGKLIYFNFIVKVLGNP